MFTLTIDVDAPTIEDAKKAFAGFNPRIAKPKKGHPFASVTQWKEGSTFIDLSPQKIIGYIKNSGVRYSQEDVFVFIPSKNETVKGKLITIKKQAS
jgi:hypothetical protein